MIPRTRVAFDAEIERLEIDWCRSAEECGNGKNHRRGFADAHAIHLDAEVANRLSLYRALHEVGHVVHGRAYRQLDGASVRPRRWERERDAEDYARRRMRELGFPVPRACVAKGDAYVERLRRWGDRISRSRRSA